MVVCRAGDYGAMSGGTVEFRHGLGNNTFWRAYRGMLWVCEIDTLKKQDPVTVTRLGFTT